MYTILLNDDKSLVATAPQVIYQNENAADSLRFLLPETLDDVPIKDSTIFVSYIRSDNRADVDRLSPLPELYNGYLDYHLKVASRITKVPGKVCLFLQIYHGDPNSPTVMKSGEHELVITAAKNMDHYIADIQVSALYRMQHAIDRLSAGQSDLAAAQESMRADIPDDLIVADRRLHLSKDEEPMGHGVGLETIDEPVIFDNSGEEPPKEPSPDDDDVIIFGLIPEEPPIVQYTEDEVILF